MEQPSSKDIQLAKEYLRRRVEAETRMEHRLESLLLAAATEIIALAYKRSIPPTLFSFSYDPFLSREVDEVIRKLLSQIEDYDIRLATSNGKAERSDLLPYIYREIDGITYSQRISHYTSRFKDELQHFIAAALVAGMSRQDLMDEVRKSYKRPSQSSLYHDREVRGQSAFHRLLLLTRHTIADAWMHADMEQAIRKGAIGFISRRGSNYPCQLCDDMANRFHTFAEPYPPYHPRCVCYAIPIYKEQNL